MRFADYPLGTPESGDVVLGKKSTGAVNRFQTDDLGGNSGSGSGDGPVTVKTVDYSILAADANKQFSNRGAAGLVNLTLPAVVADLNYGFVVETAQRLKIIGDVADSFIIGTKRFDPIPEIPEIPEIPGAPIASVDTGVFLYLVKCNAGFTRFVACGYDTNVYTSVDGHTWVTKAVDTDIYWVGFRGTDSDKLLAVDADTGKIWLSDDFGLTWTEANDSDPTDGLSAACCSDDGQNCAALTYGSLTASVWTSTNGGVDWTQQAGAAFPSGTYQIECSADGSKLVTIDFNSVIQISDDYGATWAPTPTQPVPLTGTIYSVGCSADGQNLFCGEEPGPIWYSANRGTTWTELTAYQDYWYLVSTRPPGATGQYAVMTGYTNDITYPGRVWTSNDYGATWAQNTDFPSNDYGDATISSDGTKVITCEYGGTLIRFTEAQPPTPAVPAVPAVPASIESNEPDSYLRLKAAGPNIWVATNAVGRWSGFASGVIVDTIANILARTPYDGLIAFATDIEQTLIALDGTWKIASDYYTALTANPDLGAEQYSNRIGYGRDYITDKRISYASLGPNDKTVEGGIRYNAIDKSFECYLNGAWRDFVSGITMRLQDGVLQHLLVHGSNTWINVFSGNSVDVGLNGLPIIQGYKVSLGAYPPEPTIEGGSF